MDEAARAARSLLAMSVARRAVTALAAARIDVMPLKGVLFVALGLPGATTRYVGDVDLLVREEHFDEAVRLLSAHGFREVARVSHAATLWNEELGFHLDLHRRLFPRGWFRMPSADVFARSARRDVGLGAPVMVMDPYDVYAHLVGHFTCGRHNASDGRHVADFGAVATGLSLDPSRAADRLVASGLGRAARYALRETAGGARSSHGSTVLTALPRDRVGDALAFAGHVVLGRYGRHRLGGSAPAHLLSATVPQAVVVLAWTVWDRALA